MKKYIVEAFLLLLSAAHFFIAVIAVCVLFGEESTSAPINVIEFVGDRLLAAAALYGIYRSFLWRGAHNLLPLCEKDNYVKLTSPESDADRI